MLPDRNKPRPPAATKIPPTDNRIRRFSVVPATGGLGVTVDRTVGRAVAIPVEVDGARVTVEEGIQVTPGWVVSQIGPKVGNWADAFSMWLKGFPMTDNIRMIIAKTITRRMGIHIHCGILDLACQA